MVTSRGDTEAVGFEGGECKKDSAVTTTNSLNNIALYADNASNKSFTTRLLTLEGQLQDVEEL